MLENHMVIDGPDAPWNDPGETEAEEKARNAYESRLESLTQLQDAIDQQQAAASDLNLEDVEAALELAYYRVEAEIRALTGACCSIVQQHRKGKTCHRCSRYQQVSARRIR